MSASVLSWNDCAPWSPEACGVHVAGSFTASPQSARSLGAHSNGSLSQISIAIPGEFGTVVIVAQDRKQAKVILRYIKGLIDGVKYFKQDKTGETQWSLEFTKQRIMIEIFTTSFRATRGYTVVAALLDEVAFWRSEETANPEEERINVSKDIYRPAAFNYP